MVKNCGTCEVGWVDLDLVTCYVTVVQNCCLSYLACGHRFAVPDVFPFFFFSVLYSKTLNTKFIYCNDRSFNLGF